jgi:hypothetical protein
MHTRTSLALVLSLFAAAACTAQCDWQPRAPPYHDADLTPSRHVRIVLIDDGSLRISNARIKEERQLLTGTRRDLAGLFHPVAAVPLSSIKSLDLARCAPKRTAVDAVVDFVVHLAILGGFVASAVLSAFA